MSFSGPLTGIKVVELAGLGPSPYACLLMAELGAEVTRLDRPTDSGALPFKDPLGRSRRRITVDMKSEEGKQQYFELVQDADVVIEGWRPGVAERLGIGPEETLAANPRIVYGRMTGWGQTGPLANQVGHDINYVGLTGALHAIGPAERPAIPLNLVADFGGGTMFLLLGVLSALIERQTSGQGQVIDAAMIDGVSNLMTMFYGLQATGNWQDRRQSNLLDGGTPFYDVYETQDGKFMTVGALEPQFFQALMQTLELSYEQYDVSQWEQMRQDLTEAFKSKTRDEWTEIFNDVEACVFPVLSMEEAPHHPQFVARNVFSPDGDGFRPRPAPVFSRSVVEEIADEDNTEN